MIRIVLTTIFDFIKSEFSIFAPPTLGASVAGVSLGITINTISVAISCLAVVAGLVLSIWNFSLKRKILKKEYEQLLKNEKHE